MTDKTLKEIAAELAKTTANAVDAEVKAPTQAQRDAEALITRIKPHLEVLKNELLSNGVIDADIVTDGQSFKHGPTKFRWLICVKWSVGGIESRLGLVADILDDTVNGCARRGESALLRFVYMTTMRYVHTYQDWCRDTVHDLAQMLTGPDDSSPITIHHDKNQ